MRNKPVRDITIFLPTEDVKKSDHFIEYVLDRCKNNAAEGNSLS